MLVCWGSAEHYSLNYVKKIPMALNLPVSMCYERNVRPCSSHSSFLFHGNASMNYTMSQPCMNEQRNGHSSHIAGSRFLLTCKRNSGNMNCTRLLIRRMKKPNDNKAKHKLQVGVVCYFGICLLANGCPWRGQRSGVTHFLVTFPHVQNIPQ